MTATPKATAVVCPTRPVHRPRVTRSPAIFPRNADCVSTKILSGPGASPSSTEAMKKVARVSMGIIVFSSQSIVGQHVDASLDKRVGRISGGKWPSVWLTIVPAGRVPAPYHGTTSTSRSRSMPKVWATDARTCSDRSRISRPVAPPRLTITSA